MPNGGIDGEVLRKEVTKLASAIKDGDLVLCIQTEAIGCGKQIFLHPIAVYTPISYSIRVSQVWLFLFSETHFGGLSARKGVSH